MNSYIGHNTMTLSRRLTYHLLDTSAIKTSNYKTTITPKNLHPPIYEKFSITTQKNIKIAIKIAKNSLKQYALKYIKKA